MTKTLKEPDRKSYTIDELKWLRLKSPQFIPKPLIEQIKTREYTVEDFYKLHENNCEMMIDGMLRLNPFSHLYGLIDPDFRVRGVLWFTVDALTKNAFIQTYSIEKEYWNKGKAVKKLEDMVKLIMEGANIKKAFWFTRYPKHSEHHGFKRSKNILMEYSGE